MSWFSSLCRSMGLMIHNIRNPDEAKRKVISKTQEEKQVGRTILRRTTIEEIETLPDEKNDNPPRS